jgi:hypothetical protein
MKSAPEKIVMLEVAMVRLTKPELDNSYESLDERLLKLERGATRSLAPAPEAARPVLRPIGSTVTASAPPEKPAPTPKAVVEAPPSDSMPSSEKPSSTQEVSLSLADVRERFVERVIPRTSRSAQLLLRSAVVESLDGLLMTIALPSEEMRQNTELIAQGLKGALEHEFKAPLSIYWTVDASLVSAPPPTRRPVAKVQTDDEELDVSDETALVVDSVAGHLITEMFPGAEEIS